MNSEELDKAFEQAVATINNHEQPFPADLLLRLYAYYKVATKNKELPSGSKPLITAFKTNALFQIKNMTADEAKMKYIEAVNHYLLYRK
ncbi:acyl-CoA-binding protein [Gilvibacter sp. SZ-19]|jgi:acyl-CoA-binding protein|uniref:acyl-CoA-binding protein n=1 Tax=unclassified Gilvibacter TaxID=2625242 RepID=UPI000B3CB3E9|nr:acyl-CoA-binding protein [Gilvibacter sp. SZ-19]ARV11292.1 acyl-CoA-binding protein [Gilvibacter sp. SZ-19]